MAKRKLYWGTKERMTWIPCPAINAGLGSSRWLATGGFLNGGAYQRQSTIGAKTYSFAWNPQAAEGLYELEGYFDGIHGQGPFYFLDPFAATSNVLPAFLAAPSTMAGDAPNFGGTQRISRVLTGTNPQGYPAQSGQFTVGSAFGPYKSYTMPIPADHDLHLGVHGSASGTASVKATLSGASIQRTNLATNPKLTDTYGTTSVPAIATNYARNPRALTSAFGIYSLGTGEAVTTSYLTGQSDGPPGTGITSYGRSLITTARTGGSSGWTALSAGQRDPMTGAAGDVVTASVWIRYTGPGTLEGWMRCAVHVDSTAVTIASVPYTAQSGVWTRVSATVTATGAYNAVGFWAYHSGTGTWVAPVGSTTDATGAMYEIASTPSEYFDGATSNVDPFAYIWEGTANNSASTKRYAVAVGGTAPTPRSMSGGGLSVNLNMSTGGAGTRVYVEGDYLVVDSLATTSGFASVFIARSTTVAGDAMKRLNLVPGKTYAMGVLYSQDMVHTTTASLPRQMNTVYRNAEGVDTLNYVVSNIAPNEVQTDTPLTMAFTVPADAQDYCVRLLSGAQGRLDRAKFRNLIICEGVNEADALSKVQNYFDGDTVFGGWTGVANRSTSEFPVNGTQNLPMLPVSSAQRTNVVIPGEAWCDISVGGEGTLTLAGLIGQILPTGQTVEPGNFIPGRGNTGVRLSGNPSVTGYSAAVTNASVGMTAEFVETGAWEQ